MFNSHPYKHREMFVAQTHDRLPPATVNYIYFAWFYDRKALRSKMKEAYYEAVEHQARIKIQAIGARATITSSPKYMEDYQLYTRKQMINNVRQQTVK